MRFRTAVTLALFGALIGGAPGAVAAPTASATTTTTYVDCSAPTPGRGTETSPLNSLTQLKSAFDPGRKVLLRRGSTCVGTVVINASGRAGADTLLGAYGAGKAPVIDAKASAHNRRSAIEVDNKSHFVIQDLTVRNGYFNDISVEAHNGEHITGVTIQRVTAQQNVWTGGANSVTKNMWVMGRWRDLRHAVFGEGADFSGHHQQGGGQPHSLRWGAARLSPAVPVVGF